MLKFVITLWLFFFSSCLYGQTRKFNNSVVKGKSITCSDYVEKYPCYNSTCRKIGKWIYYYKNGNIERLENYKKIKDCSSNEIPDGIWQYFNEQGALIKQDVYKNGILWRSDIAKFYFNEQLAGEVLVRNGIRDTLAYFQADSLNLIVNGDFNLYFGQPQLLISDGQDEIGKQIPFWYSQNKNTADYYNQFRRLKNVPDNINHAYNEAYHYVGIILYHKPTGNYSEYITGNILPNPEPQKKYCLRLRIRLSQNSGFYIDKLGAYFSDSISTLGTVFPQIVFDQKLANSEEWMDLCALYTATGSEKCITLGRFSNLNETLIEPVTFSNLSEGDYNQSAYYLIDKIELSADTLYCNCKIENKELKVSDRIDFVLLDPMDSLIKDKVYVLNNIFFEFDKSELLPASFAELEELFTFLKTNDDTIIISGHTDNIGSYDYNKELSLSRAQSVSAWLTDKGVKRSRIQIEGYGSDLPIRDNRSEENRAINRRVEFRIK